MNAPIHLTFSPPLGTMSYRVNVKTNEGLEDYNVRCESYRLIDGFLSLTRPNLVDGKSERNVDSLNIKLSKIIDFTTIEVSDE